MDYDVLLIHPPAIYDFRKKVIFYGPIASTVSESTSQFVTPPIGMLSIADYLDRNGYRVLVDNIGERMVTSESFDVETHIANLSATVYAIGLHWCVHSQGAIEIAKLCKKLHPEALVVLGGLTSTVFHVEIVRRYEFVDAVIRGEAEQPFLLLLRALEAHQGLEKVPNLTFRNGEGEVKSVPLMEPSADLDEFEYSRFDLLEPKGAIFGRGLPPHWSVPICRGCLHNCAGCGGSAYSYRTYFGRKKPAFRSSGKIIQDIRKLREQRVERIFLFQDPRMGGKGYWRSLLTALQNEKIKLTQLTMELFGPADEEYIRELSKIAAPLVLTISPESCVEGVRKAYGRNYTNEALFQTIRTCQRYDIPVGIFSMIPLPNDSRKTIRQTWKAWEQLSLTSEASGSKTPLHFAFGPMILLDPGSPAFDFPGRHGYRLLFKTLADYVTGLSLPSWHQWISFETLSLNRDSITELILDSVGCSIDLEEKQGLRSSLDADAARLWSVMANRLAIGVVNDAMSLGEGARAERLRSFRGALENKLREISNAS
ncbi:MAG TPA: radical SAM protein [Anaerolineales bacterium]|nr:radical SAM protein [Anaerolineales bacterium]